MAKKGKPRNTNPKSRPPKAGSTPRSSQGSGSRSATPEAVSELEMPFNRTNYILLAIGVAIIALGFYLMSLDEFVDATEFSISLHVAPVIVVAGFAEVIFAIRNKAKVEAAQEPTA